MIKDAERALKELNEQKRHSQGGVERIGQEDVQQPPSDANSRSDDSFPWDVEALLARCGKPEPLPLGGCILRGALADDEQRHLYLLLYESINIHDDSQEMNGLRLTRSPADHRRHNPDNRPQPFVTWVHPYTRESNARERPARLLRWSEELMHRLAPDSASHEVDSMLAQLYAPGGSLLRHRDEDLSWGVGVSLGSSAEFDIFHTPRKGGKEKRVRVVIRSGDILVGEFGKTCHAVSVPEKDNDPPSWWDGVDHFGSKMRCNVLFRRALTAERQRELAEERARRLCGMSLGELREKTGKDDAYLSVYLRHMALE